MNKSNFLLILIVIATGFGCSRSGTESGNVSSRKLDSLRSHFEFLESELALNWSVMIEDDDEKLFSLKRLLEEVSYTGAFNEKQFNQLMEEVDDLKALRYDQESMSNSHLIDDYDSVTNRVISEVIEFAQYHPEYESFPLMDELVNDIMEAQYNVLNYRIIYDRSADEFNYFIQDHHEIMDQITSKEISQSAVFRIEE